MYASQHGVEDKCSNFDALISSGSILPCDSIDFVIGGKFFDINAFYQFFHFRQEFYVLTSLADRAIPEVQLRMYCLYHLPD